MILIDINHLSVAFGDKTVLDNVTLVIQKGTCVGLTGLNGAGKTTLMKCLMGQQEFSGTISTVRNLKIGYLEQHHRADGTHSVWEEACKSYEKLFAAEKRMRALEEQMAEGDLGELADKYAQAQDEFEREGGYGWQSKLQGVLKGLGLPESLWEQPVNTLSGGEKTRLALARLLLSDNDVLLLDEPTNHLDLPCAQWLTDFLERYDGTVVLISHDRYMMDRLCDGVAQIDHGKLRYFDGNYTAFTRKWEEELKADKRVYDKQQDEIRRQRAIIARFRQFNREKSIRAAESREKVLERMELVDAPETHEDMRLSFRVARPSGSDVLTVTGLSKGFDGRTLFSDFSAVVKKGQKIAVLGMNGAGKTTLTDLLRGAARPDKGEVVRGVNVDIGYYEQGQKAFTGPDTVMDMVWLGDRDLTQTEVRTRCASLLFFGEDVFKTGDILSGGERARCALAQLSLTGANLLFLDEPTNHLDMDSREVLEDALERYEGTLIAVSHDRYFINRIFDTLWIVENGRITVFKGNYDDYLRFLRGEAPEEEEKTVNKTQQAKDRAKEKQAREEEKKRRQRALELEKRVTELENEKKEMEKIFADPAFYEDAARVRATQERYDNLTRELAEAEEAWMEAAEE